MLELSYNDFCTITRGDGTYDEWDNPVSEVIYEGVCDFQPGGQTSMSVVSHNDVVYLPKQVLVLENDVIEVRAKSGRTRQGVVKLANDLELDMFSDEYITEIEIKQSKGD